MIHGLTDPLQAVRNWNYWQINWPNQGSSMKDIKQRIEKLRVDAEECALISKLATSATKQEAFRKLAEEYSARSSAGLTSTDMER
jgi:hypothetical protein